MPKGKFPKYFYLNKNLHKKLVINRGKDQIITWCYPLRKRVTYTYTETKRNYEPAFSTRQVADMLCRDYFVIARYIFKGDIEPPQHTYHIGETNREIFAYYWHEDDVLKAHEFLSTVHRGRPRNDGLVTPQHLPTRRELLALMRNEEVLYIKDGDEFKPVWKAPDFS